MSNREDVEVCKLLVIKNCTALAATALLILGLYFMSESWYSLWGLLLACFQSDINVKDEKEGDGN